MNKLTEFFVEGNLKKQTKRMNQSKVFNSIHKAHKQIFN